MAMKDLKEAVTTTTGADRELSIHSEGVGGSGPFCAFVDGETMTGLTCEYLVS